MWEIGAQILWEISVGEKRREGRQRTAAQISCDRGCACACVCVCVCVCVCTRVCLLSILCGAPESEQDSCLVALEAICSSVEVVDERARIDFSFFSLLGLDDYKSL